MTLLVSGVADAATGDITTVAGGGGNGDGGPALDANLGYIRSVAVDAAGNFFIGDDSRVRKVDAQGTITTVAGDGLNHYSGDNGPATEAGLGSSVRAAVAPDGSLYIADEYHNRVRRVRPDGIIVTVAGTGQAGFSGDGGPARQARLNGPNDVGFDAAGNLYISDSFNRRVRKVTPQGTIRTYAGSGRPAQSLFDCRGVSGDGAAATKARLTCVQGLGVDEAGSVYIAEGDENSVRKIDASTRIISTVAGNGSQGDSGDGGPATEAGLYLPVDVTAGGGNLYISERFGNVVRRVDSAGIIARFAGHGDSLGDGGPAMDAQLGEPHGVALEPGGSVLIADTLGLRVRRVGTDGIISTVAGNGTRTYRGDGGTATEARLYVPSGLAVDAAGNLFIADRWNYRVRRVDLQGTITTVAGVGNQGPSGDGGPATEAGFEPVDLAVGPDGTLFIADVWNNRVRRVGPDGTISTYAGSDRYGGYGGDGGPATEALLYSPSGLALDAAGNLYIADTLNSRIRMVAPDGTISTVVGPGESLPPSCRHRRPFRALDSLGGVVCVPLFLEEPPPIEPGNIVAPLDVEAAPDGTLYVADTEHHRIVRRDPSGAMSVVAGTGADGFSGDGGPATKATLSYPSAVALGPDGSLYLVDSGNARIRRIDPQGTISTVAGTGQCCDSGEGGPATQADISPHRGLEVDGAGNVLLSDGDERVRLIEGPL